MKESTLTGGVISLFGLAATAAVFPESPSYIVPVAVSLGVGVCVYCYMSQCNDKLENLFSCCNLYSKSHNQHNIVLPKIIKKIHKEDNEEYYLTLPPGLSLTDFKTKQEAISQGMNAYIDFRYKDGNIIMVVDSKTLKKSYPFSQIKTDEPLELTLGYTRSGLLTLPLNKSASPHLLIAGESNSGKSCLLRGIIVQLILDKKPEDVELYLFDPKRVELSIFKNCKHVINFSKEIGDIKETLCYLCQETERRYIQLEKLGLVNISDYNKKYDKKMNYKLAIIDEFSDLSDDKDCIKYIHALAKKSRAVGIHLILSTQRPDANTITGGVRANIGNIVGLKTSSMVNSQIIIDKPGLENLRGYGHAILKSAGEYIEFQTMFIDVKNAQKLIKHTHVNKPHSNKKNKLKGYIEIDGTEE